MPFNPLFAPTEKSLVERRVLQGPIGVRQVVKQAGCAQDLIAGVDAREELGRADDALNGVELGLLNHARRSSELARRIDLDLDAPVGVPLNDGGELLHPLMLCVVERAGAELHDVLSQSRRNLRTDGQRANKHDCQQPM